MRKKNKNLNRPERRKSRVSVQRKFFQAWKAGQKRLNEVISKQKSQILLTGYGKIKNKAQSASQIKVSSDAYVLFYAPRHPDLIDIAGNKLTFAIAVAIYGKCS